MADEVDAPVHLMEPARGQPQGDLVAAHARGHQLPPRAVAPRAAQSPDPQIDWRIRRYTQLNPALDSSAPLLPVQ
jgi:hypothetical protein